MAVKILLADDSITIQKVITLTFAAEDFDLTIESNGDAAVARAAELKPDLIMADVSMPGKNGYEVCEAIKNDPALSSIPVLLLAGTFEPLDPDEAERVGIDDHIIKPFESEDLINKVKALISRAKGVAPMEKTVEPVKTAEPTIVQPTPREPTPPEPTPPKPTFVQPAPPEPAPPEASTEQQKPSIADNVWEASDFLGSIEEEKEPATPTDATSTDIFGVKGDTGEEKKAEEEFFDLELTEEELQPIEAEKPKPAAPAAPPAPLELTEKPPEETVVYAPGDMPIPPATSIPKPPVAIEEPTPDAFRQTPEPPTKRPVTPPPPPPPPPPGPGVAEEPQPVSGKSILEKIEERAVATIQAEHDGVLNLPREVMEEIVKKVTREVVEEIAWEVVPELAEELITAELDRMREILGKGK